METPMNQRIKMSQNAIDPLVKERAKSRLAFMAKAYPGCLHKSTEYLEYGFLELEAALLFMQWDRRRLTENVKKGKIEVVEQAVGKKFRKPSLKFVKPGQKTQKWYSVFQLTRIRFEIYGMDDSDPEVLD